MAEPIDIAIAELAGAQFGVVTRAQLAALGLGRGAIERRLLARRLVRLHRGVYAFGHTHLRREGHLLGALFACGLGAVLSHRSAGDWWAIWRSTRWSVEVTVESRGRRRRRPGIDLHCVRRLDPRDVTIHDGMPVTTVARTLVDLSTTMPPRVVERALEQAYVHRLLAPGAVEDALGRARGRRTGTLSALLCAEASTSTPTRNDLEEAFLAIVRRIGLPDPEVNTDLGAYSPDFLWRDKRLIIETDGYGAHGTKRAFERDRGRDIDLELAGWNVRRFTHDQVMCEPASTGDRLLRLYRAQ